MSDSPAAKETSNGLLNLRLITCHILAGSGKSEPEGCNTTRQTLLKDFSMSGDVNYPEQPTYGEGLADALRAQVNLLQGTGEFEDTGGLLELLPLERDVRQAYQGLQQDLLQQQLLGDITRFDEEGRAQVATRQVPVDPEALGGYSVRINTAGNKELIDPEGNRVAYTGQGYENLLGYLPAEYQDAFQKQIVEGTEFTEEPVYAEGTPGTIASRSGGLLDIYGGTTRVRQYDPETGEVKYGTAGFDPETDEFQGLVPMQAQAQQYLSTQQREGDIADVEMLGGRATEAIRAQGNIGEYLENLQSNVPASAQSQAMRSTLMSRGAELLGQGLTGLERQQIRQASRAAGVAAGRPRDAGRIAGEVVDLVTADRQRQMENLGVAQRLLSAETGMSQQDFSRILQGLGAEQATAADPMMAILGRPSSAAPGAQALLGSGAAMQQQAGPSLINPEAGLGYISQRAANQATVAAGQAAGQGSMMGGLLKGIGSIAAAPVTGGTSLIGKILS